MRTAIRVTATAAVAVAAVTAAATPAFASASGPASGAVFAAPANVKIAADATVSGGSVTNVAFFGNSIGLGSARIAPFSITASNLAAGSYSLTAVATAGGVSTTSSVVNITVVTPVAISLSAPTLASGQFSFSYSANPGLTYVVQHSSDFVAWSTAVTNVALTSTVQFHESAGSANGRFYRVARLPNP